ELEPVEEPESTEPGAGDEDVLEVLPVVLSDDTRELIEIDKVDQDRLYMFENEFDKSEEIREGYESPADLQDLDAADDHGPADDVEDLEPIEPAEDAGEAPISTDGVAFIGIEDILDRVRSAEQGDAVGAAAPAGAGGSMESLIMTRTTGILPGADDMEDAFLFDDETPVLAWSAEGLDYDRYLRGFKKGATGVYKSLMSLSKEYNALCGVLMAGTRKGLESDYAVGLDDESASFLSVTKNESVWDAWFAERKVVVVPDLADSPYAEKTRHNEYRYIKAALFLPALYHGAEAYLFMGFKEAPSDPMALLINVETAK
ncbi:MAG: hypothetical protein MI892_17570, partial [Desulfobacterales bacterium]|nr:hypothetical protein [Desulfobacterales bacterium]